MRTMTVEDEADLVVPPSVRKQAGFKLGDRLELHAAKGVITIVNRSAIAEEYTPAQRKKIDAQLTQAQNGPHHGPFSTPEEAIAFINFEVRARKRSRTGRASRTRK